MNVRRDSGGNSNAAAARVIYEPNSVNNQFSGPLYSLVTRRQSRSFEWFSPQSKAKARRFRATQAVETLSLESRNYLTSRGLWRLNQIKTWESLKKITGVIDPVDTTG